MTRVKGTLSVVYLLAAVSAATLAQLVVSQFWIDVMLVIAIAMAWMTVAPIIDSRIVFADGFPWRLLGTTVAASAISMTLYALYLVTIRGDDFFEAHLAKYASLVFLVTTLTTCLLVLTTFFFVAKIKFREI